MMKKMTALLLVFLLIMSSTAICSAAQIEPVALIM